MGEASGQSPLLVRKVLNGEYKNLPTKYFSYNPKTYCSLAASAQGDCEHPKIPILPLKQPL